MNWVRKDHSSTASCFYGVAPFWPLARVSFDKLPLQQVFVDQKRLRVWCFTELKPRVYFAINYIWLHHTGDWSVTLYLLIHLKLVWMQSSEMRPFDFRTKTRRFKQLRDWLLAIIRAFFETFICTTLKGFTDYLIAQFSMSCEQPTGISLGWNIKAKVNLTGNLTICVHETGICSSYISPKSNNKPL